MHLNSILLYEKYALRHIKPGMKVLEIGPSTFPSDYQKRATADVEWHTIDIYENPKLTYSNSAEYNFPIEDNSYDLVISGQVMEHVRKIWLWIAELERVCKPGGKVITVSPISWPYHEAPVDCWRIYPEGMRALLEDTELDIEECIYESLEATEFKSHIPGRSLEWVGPKLRLFYKLFGKLGLPVERSYDLITISTKKS